MSKAITISSTVALFLMSKENLSGYYSVFYLNTKNEGFDHFNSYKTYTGQESIIKLDFLLTPFGLIMEVNTSVKYSTSGNFNIVSGIKKAYC